jgi:gamma-glutamylcyclotransferase (GGCT)/AIG2-like uncharacterized protein YtfP
MMVFVYGTLMRGEENHGSFLEGSGFICVAELPGYALYNVDRCFPGIVPEEGERVKGEVYEIDSATLEGLDLLEEEGSLYIRRQVDLDTAEGPMKAFTYIWNNDVSGMEKLNYEDQPWKGIR